MKLNKNSFSLNLLIISSTDYEGSICVEYSDKMFQKEISMNDTSHLSSSDDNKRRLTDKESKLVSQILSPINKEFEKKGFKLEQLNIHYTQNFGNLLISYHLGEDMNTIEIGLNEDTTIAKKTQSLCKSLTKRLLRELK